ncbi:MULTISPECIES: hypothetical protein [Pseudomonas]|jgi:hypothetical protein|uniref:Uncharacterized protein n=1 Tax=Pseudomonas fluorescens TaxID=294 RepID=A0A5E7RSM2_PSEFL|nr:MULTISPECIES: hypothetical protein [Pseudomonas]VVP76730.1 hypothetical protein PS928_00339 [Pseudomonas fluorescens]
MRFPHRLNLERHPMTDESTPSFEEQQANVLIGTAEKMIEIWHRLSPEKQAALLARFGSEENALAALVTTQLVAPQHPE